MKRIIATLFVFILTVGMFAPITFSLAPQNNFVGVSVVHAQALSTSSNADNNVFNHIGECGVFFGSMGYCLAYVFYFVPYFVGGQVLTAAAHFLDLTVSLALSSDLFTQSPFLQTGWAMMRDIANVFFILMLLYIAILIMLDQPMSGGGSPKKMIWSVILMAILINFSMFVTDIVIDTSNTLALVFYNQISVTSQTTGPVTTDPNLQVASNQIAGGIATVAPKEISLSLASAFHPQQFNSPGFWNGLKDPKAPSGDPVPATTMITLVLIMGILYCVVAWSFFVAGASFLGRIVELFVIIIFYPISFVSYIVPGMRGIDRLGWSDWWKRLSDVAFSAPLYLMMIYLIALILNGGLFGGNATSAPTITAGTWLLSLVQSVLIPAVFLFIMLSMATKFVMKASGTIGNALGGAANIAAKSVGGFALGSSMGAAAWVGRTTGGRIGERIQNSKFVQNNKTKSGWSVSGWAARAALSTGKGMQTASYDVRQTKAGAGLSKVTGMSLESYGALSTKAAAGGRVNQKARQQLADEKTVALIGHDEKAKKEIDHEVEHKQEHIESKEKELEDKKEKFEVAEKEESAAKAGVAQAEKDVKAAKALKIQADASGNPKAMKEAKNILEKAETELKKKKEDLSDAKLQTIPVKIAYENSKAEIRQLKTGDVPERYPTDKTHKDYNPDMVKKNKDGKEVGEIMRRDAKGAPVTDGSGKINYTKPITMYDSHGEVNRHPTETRNATKKEIKSAEEKGKPLTLKDANGNLQIGREYTRKEILSAQGVDGLKKMSEQVKTAQGKEFLMNKAASRYNFKDDPHAIKKNAVGDIVEFHPDIKPELRTGKAQFLQALQGFSVTVPVAFAVGTLVGGPIAGAAAAAIAGSAAVIKDVRKDSKKGDVTQDTKIDAVMGAAHNVGGEHKTHVAESSAPGKQLHENLAEAVTSIPGSITGAGGGGHPAPKKSGGGGHGGGHPAAGGHGGGGDHGHH